MLTDDDRARIAMAHEACQIADLARLAITTRDPASALAQAHQLLVTAHRLLEAAHAYAHGTNPPESFASTHPEEAADDITDWLGRHQEGEFDHSAGTFLQIR
ncbi:hypothetical protein [Kribbella sp. VKM Ac-2568]|uniref:hypothetical protein n=1 Tax=Kribbella sp. VKM Ac-2568 TaxID=2512219 RepID=UPI001051E08B|nr:hypothetical protein [Kribbella sp. VKM Ac-2568]TCM46612.1 hypothetical protein EV648_10589 [Kribbella sp. VKM Ac-2568]